MNPESLFIDKLKNRGANEAAIKSFLHGYKQLTSGADISLAEEDISPAIDIPLMDDVLINDETHYAKYLEQTVVIKLNGGLGTGMGLQKAKSLLEVKESKTFLDFIIQQNQHLEREVGGSVGFLLMNSFSTSEDTLDYLKKYPELGDLSQIEFLQNFSPKILQDNLMPAEWEENPDLEWCPPGHGDIYTALYGSGKLDELLAEGRKYAFISNSDNLGAFINPALLAYFAESANPFLMEVTERTPADSKGGHLAVRNSDEQLILREVAQCPDEDLESFQDITRHQFFNTNNLWLRLDTLKEIMDAEGGFLPLPVIQNKKTLDPRQSNSPGVYQLETAMGAAIECFKGASAVCVPRRRFAPVKTTADLLALRSDAYKVHENGRIMLIPERNGIPPTVKLSKNFKFVDEMDKLGVPSLKEATYLNVDGNVIFEQGVVIKGEAEFNSPLPLVVNRGRYGK